MKYFEKIAFDPKRLIGPVAGAAALGTLGYATAKKESKVSAGISTGILGGVIGMAFSGKRGSLPKRKSFFEGLGEKMNPLDASEKVLEKSRKAMEEIDKRKMAIKTHTTTKGEFKYTDALKYTREKKAKFIDVLTGKKIRDLSKMEKRYTKAFDYHTQKAQRDVGISENLKNLRNQLNTIAKIHIIQGKKFKEKLKTTGAWTGVGVGTAAGAEYIRKKV